MPDAKISVVLPAYQAAAYIEGAVRGLVAQTRVPDQIIVVDDGSTDETGAVLDRLRGDIPMLEVITQANAGASQARNTALARVQGDFVLLHDADDRLEHEAIATLVTALAAAPDADMIFGGCQHVDPGDTPTGVTATPDQARYSARDILIENPIHTATGVLLRRAAIDRTGGFDLALRGYIDFDLWLRVAETAPDRIAAVPDILVHYRRHPGQITGNWRRMQENWNRLCDKHADLMASLTKQEQRAARARRLLFYASVAYEAKDYASTRRLMAGCWAADPGFAASDGLARVRTAAAIASLLPAALHDRLRAHYNRG